MAVKIRLARRGRKKKAMYDVIVADAKSPRDGRLIEKIGTYNPLTNPATIDLLEDKALEWLLKGAQPTDTARRILSYKGIMLKKHLQVGVLKGAITQEQADAKFEEWMQGKESAISSQLLTINQKKAAEAKERFEAEKKVNEAKAEALRKKLAVVEPEAQTEAVEAPAEEAAAPVAEEAPAVEEAPVAEEAKEETPAVKEAPVAEEAKEETPAVEEAPAAKEAEEEAPAAEEAKVEEVREEAPAKEEKKEEKASEAAAKEEAPAEEKSEEKEEAPAEPKAEAKEDAPAEDNKKEDK